MTDYKHWATVIAERAIDKFGKDQIVCAGWSPSGKYHIGNSREAVTCYAIHKSLLELGANSKFVFVIDDFDPLDKIPQDLKQYSIELRKYLGHPINRIPDFTKQYGSYAEYFVAGAKKAMEDFGFDTVFVYASKQYSDGMYDNFLYTYSNKRQLIDQLFEDITGSRLDEFISVVCQNCGNLKTPRNITLQGNKILYECVSEKMYRGCDYKGTMTIDDHEWKLKWRLDWPSRQTFLGVTIEPSGKDHSVSGGSVDTSNAIHNQILNSNPPLLEKYGFITLKGKKFSGSKGGALAADQVNSIMQPSAYLFLVYRSDMLKDIDFNPQSSEYGKLHDEFDDGRRMLLGKEFQGREREIQKLSKAADLALFNHERGFIPADVRFDELTLIYQTSLRDVKTTISKLEEMEKISNESQKMEIAQRLQRVGQWLDTLAPSNMIIEFLSKPPEDIQSHWTKEIQDLWLNALGKIKKGDTPDDFVRYLRDVANNISPKAYYAAFYQLVSGKSSGPNATNLVFALGPEKVKSMIKTIIL